MILFLKDHKKEIVHIGKRYYVKVGRVYFKVALGKDKDKKTFASWDYNKPLTRKEIR